MTPTPDGPALLVRVVGAVLAAVPPAALIVGLVWLSRPLALEGTAPEPRGRVERRVQVLRQQDPQVLILGNSTVRTDLDPDRLSEAAGGRRAVVYNEQDSLGPTWHVVLADQVFGEGLTPELVVVGAHLQTLLAPAPGTTTELASLLASVRNDAGSLEDRLFGDDPAERGWNRFRARAHTVRTEAVNVVRDDLVGLVLGDTWHLRAEGERVLSAAYGVASAQIDPDTRWLQRLPETWARPEDSFLPDMVELVRGRGSELVVVLLPTRDRPTPEVVASERDLVRWTNEHQLQVIDARAGLGPDVYADAVHLDGAGRRVFTEQVAAELSRYLRDGFAPTRIPLPPPSLSRSGDAPVVEVGSPEREQGCRWVVRPVGLPPGSAVVPSLPDLPLRIEVDGLTLRHGYPGVAECSGTWRERPDGVLELELLPGATPRRVRVSADPAVSVSAPQVPGVEVRGVGRSGGDLVAHWVFPGTSLVARFPEEWGPAPQVVLRSDVVQLGETQGEPTFRVGGQEVPLRRDRSVWRAEVTVEGQGLELAWSSPADGPWLLVRSLTAEVDGAVLPIIGDPLLREVELDLLSPPVEVAFAGEPPATTLGPLALGGAENRAEAPFEGPLPTRDELLASLGLAACVPYSLTDARGVEHPTVAGDATVVALRPQGLASGATLALHADRRCHWWAFDGDAHRLLLFGRTSERAQFRGPQVRYAARRVLWLYPGDRATFRAVDLQVLHAGSGAVGLKARAVAGDPRLRVELRANGGPRGSWEPTAAELSGEELRLPIDEPLWRTDDGVELLLEARGEGFVFVEDLSL